MIYEIQDSKQTFFRIYEIFEAVKIYDTNWLKKEFYEAKYGSKKEDKYKIPKYVGELKLAAIIECIVINDHDQEFLYNEEEMG